MLMTFTEGAATPIEIWSVIVLARKIIINPAYNIYDRTNNYCMSPFSHFVIYDRMMEEKNNSSNKKMPRLKSWESPRRQGRNDKGKGGSARKRQLKKRQQALRNKLQRNGEEKTTLFPFSMSIYQKLWKFTFIDGCHF